jgi:hypothetical protein
MFDTRFLSATALVAVIWQPGCALEAEPEPVVENTQQSLGGFERHALPGGLAHYTLEVRVGTGPNAVLTVHRVVREAAPFAPRPGARAAMLVHGDFSTFESNFMPAGAPGMATHLAESGLDVWGVDRRWTHAPAGEADLSDFGDMGLEQDVVATDGSTRPRTLADGLDDWTVCAWTRDGILVRTPYAPIEVARINEHTGERTALPSIHPPTIGLRGVDAMMVAGDRYVYSVGQELSELYLLEPT